MTQQLALKEGDVFIVTDEFGNIPADSPLGLYHQDTRYLSLLDLRLNGCALELLNTTNVESFMLNLRFANEYFAPGDGPPVLPQTISVGRNRLILGGLHEQISLVSYNRTPLTVNLQMVLGADFRDMFDVRGFHREHWGELHPPVFDEGGLRLSYTGLDALDRRTLVRFSRWPDAVDTAAPDASQPVSSEPGIMIPVVGAPADHPVIVVPRALLTWRVTLEPEQPFVLTWHTYPQDKAPSGPDPSFDDAVAALHESYLAWQRRCSTITTSREKLTNVLARSAADLHILSEPVGDGYFPSAGLPWYAAPFGRDSLITSYQALILNPDLARGTLRVLAEHQGHEVVPLREEQPGKILHEVRFGEMARLGEIPHTPYFGSVDSTPLFVMLFVETMRWTGDEELYTALLPNVLAAVEWIDRYGDLDSDGFVEYDSGKPPVGIRNQVWKDSSDSTQFPDGTLAETPIAACEVQGYVYAAKLGLSELLASRGDTEVSARLAAEAASLKAAFNTAFWMPEADYYAQGLDSAKRRIPTITSNPGHCLWTGIADDDKAAAVARRVVAPDMSSGWGVRTISRDSPSYNPMSYHNGSIWPHDNSLLVAGLRRYGLRDAALTVTNQLYQAALQFRYYRLPELYCGFDRDERYGSGPAEYPVSCSPQAWASAAPLLLTRSLLGLEPAADGPRLDPWLPAWLPAIEVRDLRMGGHRYSLRAADGHGAVLVDCQKQAE
ncbi:MAG: amylo-alpha-1,6-glucosidase [Chloroflexia bacterium]